MGFVSIADYGVLPPALKHFRASFPLVEVQLHELTTDAQIRELRATRLDLGIALAPVDEPDLEFERLLREELVLAAPSGHPAVKGSGAVDLRALAKESFIIPPRDIASGSLRPDHQSLPCSSGLHLESPNMRGRCKPWWVWYRVEWGSRWFPSSVRNLKRTGVQYRPLRGKAAVVEIGTSAPAGCAEHGAQTISPKLCARRRALREFRRRAAETDCRAIPVQEGLSNLHGRSQAVGGAKFRRFHLVGPIGVGCRGYHI